MCPRQKSKNGNMIFVILLLVGFFFVICRFTYPLKFVKTLIYCAIYPNLNTMNCVFYSIGKFPNTIRSIIHVYQENVLYKKKNQELIDGLRNYVTMSEEYNGLLKLLKLNIPKNAVSVFSRISVMEPNGWYKWFIINKGEKDGLYNELPVVMFNTGNNALCPVGKIIEVHKTFSKVIMITNSNCTLPVEIKDKGINCLAEGFNNSNLLKIKYIPCKADVKPGDEVIVSSLSTVFQKGMPVGIIVNISKDEAIDFKTAIARVHFEKNNIWQVIILVPQAKQK
jgi:rod shape-determining protein MreC